MSEVITLLESHLMDLVQMPEFKGTPVANRTMWGPLTRLPGWALIEDGKTIAAGGILDLWQGVGEVWVAASEFSIKHPMMLARGVLQTLKYIESHGTYHRLQMTVDTCPELLRWATWLGFKLEGTMHKYLANGKDRYLFAKTYGS